MRQMLTKEEMLHFLQNQSRYQISQFTGISEQTLGHYANGKTDILKMSLGNAIKISDYYLELNK